jgi:peptide/nickel transport system substrate-binding protein
MTAEQNFLGMLVLNTASPALKDPRVREAVTLAFPFEEATEDAYHGYAKIPNGPLPDGMFGWNSDLPQFKQDIPRAKQLLAEAGHPNGGFTLTAAVLGASVDQRNQALLLQEGLSEIGVRLNVRQLSFPAMVALMDDPKTAVDISANGLGAYSIDPIVYMAQMYAGYNIGRGTLQFTYLRDDEIDKTLKAAQEAASPEEVERLVKEAQRLIRDAWAGIPTAQSMYTDAISDKVKGYVFNPSDYFFIPRFYYISKSA